MSLLLLRHASPTSTTITLPSTDKTRYRKGIRSVIDRGIPPKQQVTLAEAVRVLIEGW